MDLFGKTVVVYGAGVSGIAAYELAKDMGAKVIIYDDNPMAQRATNSTQVFSLADVIVLSPGVASEKDFLFDAKLENKIVISELELASSVSKAEQIAITGTNGKTTTTRMIDAIFKTAGKSSRAVGNIGVAFSTIADKLTADDIAVIEASSFQLEGCVNFAPHISVLLNVTPDHLERHGCMQKYIDAKAKIFAKQTADDFCVFNADDTQILGLADRIVAKKVPFCLSHPVTNGAYLSSGFVCFKGEPILSLDEISFKGRELENVLAAVSVAMIEGVSPYSISKALANFKPDRYRRELVGVFDGISVYNDSKATNVYSCLSGCEAMDCDFVLILGGARRAENFEELFSQLPTTAKHIVVCGENEREILSAAHAYDYDSIEKAETLEQAYAEAYDLAKQAGVKAILFSPASKSFDKFKNYEDRGKAFDLAVKNYSK